ASRASWVPADKTADNAPLLAARRAANAGLGRSPRPRPAFVLARSAQPLWRCTKVMGEKIFYRQWTYSQIPAD
ncbi:unnamed protein product, partial [Polarella glacialis]